VQAPSKPRILLAVAIGYLFGSIALGILLCEGALHPLRTPLGTHSDIELRLAPLRSQSFADVSIVAVGGITLRGWLIQPKMNNGNAVILLHGLSDNRLGMIGYAELLLRHGYSVLMPDARAHGASEGEFATYGLLEKDDIRLWFAWLQARLHPDCIYGFGESMGAAQLLQAIALEPRFCAAAAESSFSSFQEIAFDRIGQPFHLGPWFGRTVMRPAVEVAFLYGRWKYGFDMKSVSPANAVQESRAPILLIHGAQDSNIPVRHSLRLADIRSAVVLWEVPGADHCGAISVAPEEFETRVVEWLDKHSNPPRVH
jgi:uncharacterized protein